VSLLRPQEVLQLKYYGIGALAFKSSVNGMQKLQQLSYARTTHYKIIQIDRTSIEAVGVEKERLDDFWYDIDNLFQTSMDVYQSLLEAGVAKECAREVLPLATPTTLYMNGTIRSWLHYVDLRTSNGTQKEHALIAAQIQDLLYQHLPNVCEAMWNKS
jgi:flavin-dependent thymidylate synthase